MKQEDQEHRMAVINHINPTQPGGKTWRCNRCDTDGFASLKAVREHQKEGTCEPQRLQNKAYRRLRVGPDE